MRVPRIILIAFLLWPAHAVAQKPPSAWDEPRIYHTPFDTSFADQIVLDHAPRDEKPKEAVPSSNGAYWFAVRTPDFTRPGPWTTTVAVYAEHDSLLTITFADHNNAGVDVRWINEKLLYLQVWWGRIVGTALILDVEWETFLYREMMISGQIAYEQAQQAAAEDTAHVLGYVEDRASRREQTRPVPLLDEPSGDPMGFVRRVFDSRTGTSTVEVYRTATGDTTQLDIAEGDLVGTGYGFEETMALAFYDTTATHAKVLAKSIPGGRWVTRSTRLVPISWIEDVTRHVGYQLYGYDGYRLRSAPSVDSKPLTTLREDRHVIARWTGAINGSWAEAVIYEVDRGASMLDECYNLNDLDVTREWRGWIKVVDDDGQIDDIRYAPSC